MQLPFYAVATFIIYKKYRYNFAEHLTLQIFITAQATVIATLLANIRVIAFFIIMILGILVYRIINKVFTDLDLQ